MEGLKPFDEITVPDVRSTILVLVNRETGAQFKKTLHDHYDFISQFKLREAVPENVRCNFATALNLYLYTWFCYDFLSVAEQRVFTTLEFALRERIGEERVNSFRYNERGLHGYIQYAVNHEWIRQCDFKAFENRSLENIQELYVLREQDRARKKGKELKRSDIKVPKKFNENERLKLLLWPVASFRNTHSHGANFLYPTIGFNFLVVTEFVNAIYSERVSELLKKEGTV